MLCIFLNRNTCVYLNESKCERTIQPRKQNKYKKITPGRQIKKSPHEYTEVEVEDDVYHQIQELSSEVEGEITKKILGEELSQKILVGGRQKAVENTSSLFSDVLRSDALQNAVSSLLTSIVNSASFQGACRKLIKNLWDDLINDPETTAQVIALLNTAIRDERIKNSFKELVLGLLEDEDVKRELTGLVVKLGEEKQVCSCSNVFFMGILYVCGFSTYSKLLTG